jgi:hypothetical protein
MSNDKFDRLTEQGSQAAGCDSPTDLETPEEASRKWRQEMQDRQEEFFYESPHHISHTSFLAGVRWAAEHPEAIGRRKG